MSKNLMRTLVFGLASIGVLAIGFVGGFAVQQWYAPQPNANTFNGTSIQIPDILNTDSANGGKFISCATGWVDEDVEGLFVLDHMTGTLFCWAIDPKTGLLGRSFETNVRGDLTDGGKEGDADYVMVTGTVLFSGRNFTGANKPANTVVYVGEGNSGKVGAYMLRYRAGTGVIERIGVGQTRAGILQRD